MGKQVTVQIVDDLDGVVLDEYETVKWSLDGKQYEFDTSAKNAEKFRTILAKYRDVSRRSTTATRTRGSSNVGRSKEQSQAIRDWANDNGFEVSERGRIRAEVIDAFDAAH